MSARHAGLTLPLFSARSTAGWGIGEFADLVPLARWMARAALDRLMVLPLGAVQAGETSPYSAASTFALDPVYLRLADVPDFAAAGGEAALTPEARAAIDAARRSPAVRYADVRRAKDEALRLAFGRFVDHEWRARSGRAAELARYIEQQQSWLDDFALFEVLAQARPGTSWRDWPPTLRDRKPGALAAARETFARAVLEQQYRQWLAEEQWQQATGEARRAGVEIVGDLPFGVAPHSAEVWARAGEYLLDVSVGCPPDAFSTTGQDWGLPGYNWDAIARHGDALVRQRVARMAALFRGLRVDHAVGLYRTYGTAPDGHQFFTPGEEAAEIAQGERLFRLLQDSGLQLIAEDLGSVPPFVRASLGRLGVPGCKVLRWERDWEAPDAPFFDPASYEPTSAAMTGTHDTVPNAAWWEDSPIADRTALLALDVCRRRGLASPEADWSPALRDALLELAYTAGSQDLFIMVQDVFGWADRINTPGTANEHNWTWCLPWPVDRLEGVPDAVEGAATLRALAVASGRAGLH